MGKDEPDPIVEERKKAEEAIKNTQKVHILAGLPEYLKDPEVYQKIRKASYEIMGSTCGHSEVIEWATCAKCQKKGTEHADFLRKLGFLSPAQYYAWRRVHEKVERRVKLR